MLLEGGEGGSDLSASVYRMPVRIAHGGHRFEARSPCCVDLPFYFNRTLGKIVAPRV